MIEIIPYWIGKSIERFLINLENVPKFFEPLLLISLTTSYTKKVS